MSKITDFHFKPLNEYKYNLIEKKMDIKYSKFSIGEKVKVNGLNAVVEGIGTYNNQFYYKLQGLPFDFNESELSNIDNDMIHVKLKGVFNEYKRPPLGLKPEYIHNEQRLDSINSAIERYKEAGKQIPQEWITEKLKLLNDFDKNAKLDSIIEKYKTVPCDQILRVGDKMKVKKSGKIYEIVCFVNSEVVELLGFDQPFHISELEIVLPDKNKKETYFDQYDFIATWQKQREFYLIETKGGSLSRMDKPEFEEYCEKMDKLGIKYKIIN